MTRPRIRTVAVVLAVVAVTAGASLATAAMGGALAGGAVTAVGDDAEAAKLATDTDAANGSAAGSVQSNASTTDPLACTNGTSAAVVGCGYNPGPTAVALADQETGRSSVTVRAVELESGGFVAVHRVSYVDGQFTESLLGVSGSLSSGLHRNVAVNLSESLTADTRLVAVAYRDSDGDDRFDFVASNGSTDRPYTHTYTAAEGNVTDEAGDVVGDAGRVTVRTAPTVGASAAPATDPDGDGTFEDVNGDGTVDLIDVAVLYDNRGNASVTGNPALFDFDGSGGFDLVDVSAFYRDVT